MGKLVFLLFCLVLIYTSCSKDDNNKQGDHSLTANQRQWGLAINYTATWCGPCGSWGSPLIHELSQVDEVVAITVHSANDPMFNSALYKSFNADRPSGDIIPSFWIGDEKSQELNTMNSLLQQIPVAGIGIESSQTESSITIKTKTEFFMAGSGQYYLSVLILEDGINGSESAGNYKQNGVADPVNYKHDFVLRASSVNNNVYGEELISNPEKGSIVDKEYEIVLNPGWDQHVYPVAILWQVNLFSNPQYRFINAIK